MLRAMNTYNQLTNGTIENTQKEECTTFKKVVVVKCSLDLRPTAAKNEKEKGLLWMHSMHDINPQNSHQNCSQSCNQE